MKHVHQSPHNGGYYRVYGGAVDSCAFRWHRDCRSDVYSVHTEKPAMDEGKPAKLVRSFDAVCDDFGTLVEVAA